MAARGVRRRVSQAARSPPLALLILLVALNGVHGAPLDLFHHEADEAVEIEQGRAAVAAVTSTLSHKVDPGTVGLDVSAVSLNISKKPDSFPGQGVLTSSYSSSSSSFSSSSSSSSSSQSSSKEVFENGNHYTDKTNSSNSSQKEDKKEEHHEEHGGAERPLSPLPPSLPLTTPLPETTTLSNKVEQQTSKPGPYQRPEKPQYHGTHIGTLFIPQKPPQVQHHVVTDKKPPKPPMDFAKPYLNAIIVDPAPANAPLEQRIYRALVEMEVEEGAEKENDPDNLIPIKAPTPAATHNHLDPIVTSNKPSNIEIEPEFVFGVAFQNNTVTVPVGVSTLSQQESSSDQGSSHPGLDSGVTHTESHVTAPSSQVFVVRPTTGRPTIGHPTTSKPTNSHNNHHGEQHGGHKPSSQSDNYVVLNMVGTNYYNSAAPPGTFNTLSTYVVGSGRDSSSSEESEDLDARSSIFKPLYDVPFANPDEYNAIVGGAVQASAYAEASASPGSGPVSAQASAEASVGAPSQALASASSSSSSLPQQPPSQAGQPPQSQILPPLPSGWHWMLNGQTAQPLASSSLRPSPSADPSAGTTRPPLPPGWHWIDGYTEGAGSPSQPASHPNAPTTYNSGVNRPNPWLPSAYQSQGSQGYHPTTAPLPSTSTAASTTPVPAPATSKPNPWLHPTKPDVEQGNPGESVTSTPSMPTPVAPVVVPDPEREEATEEIETEPEKPTDTSIIAPVIPPDYEKVDEDGPVVQGYGLTSPINHY